MPPPALSLTPLLIPSIKSTCWGRELTARSVSECIICRGEKQIGAEPSGLPAAQLGKVSERQFKSRGEAFFIGARCRCEWPACVDACKVWAWVPACDRGMARLMTLNYAYGAQRNGGQEPQPFSAV